MNRRICSWLLALSLCLGLLTPVGHAASFTPYWQTDDREQTAPQAALQSDAPQQTRGRVIELQLDSKGHGDLRAAVENAQSGDTIVVKGYGDVNEIVGKPKEPWVIDKKITIQGVKSGDKHPSISCRTAGIILGADVVLEDVELTLANRVRNVVMVNGHSLTLRNVTASPSTQEVHLAGGTLTGYTYNVTVPAGNHSQITLAGSTQISNIYAGGLSYADLRYPDGQDNRFDLPTTITFEGSSAKVKEIYACGAQERPVDETGDMFSPEKTKPPIPNPARFVNNGRVEINLYSNGVQLVDGRTGGSGETDVHWDGGQYKVTNVTLRDLNSLTVRSGQVQPKVESGKLAQTQVRLEQDTRLYFADFADRTIGSLTGNGGTLVLGENDSLRIDGAVTGTTTVAVGDVTNDGSYSSRPPTEGKTYIAAPQSKDGAFTLLPYQGQSAIKLVWDGKGNWIASKNGAVAQQHKVVSATAVKNPVETDKYSQPVDIPLEVTYDTPDAMPSLNQIPVEITINSSPTRLGNSTNGYRYSSSKYNLVMQFEAITDESGQKDLDALSVKSNSYSLTPGDYTIKMVIPGSHTVDGQPIPLETKLIVRNEAVPTPPPTPPAASVELSRATVEVTGGPFIYKGSAHTPTVTVTAEDGRVLVKEQHYTVSYDRNTNAGEASVTVKAVSGSGCTGSKTQTFPIEKAKLTLDTATVAEKPYDGTDRAEVTGVTFRGNGVPSPTLTADSDYTASGRFAHANVQQSGQVEVRVTLLPGAADNYSLQTDTITVSGTIRKAQATSRAGELHIRNNHAAVYSYDLMQLLPDPGTGCAFGTTTFQLGQVSLSGYNTTGTKVENGELQLHVDQVPGTTEQQVGTVTITITSENYTLTDATIAVRTVNKAIPTGDPVLSATRLTYGQPLSTITLSGHMNGGSVQGTFVWVEPEKQYDAGPQQPQWRFTPTDGAQYETVTGTARITVDKAKPTGTPQCTPITAPGKPLSDAKLTGTFSTKGTLAWKEPATVVQPNTAYEWVFTPDSGNFESLTGKLTPYVVSGGGSSGGGSGSGGSGGSGSGGGSSHSGGSSHGGGNSSTSNGITTTVNRQPGGAVETSQTTSGGTVGTVIEEANGRVSRATARVSDYEARESEKRGVPVKLPLEIPVSASAAWAPVVQVSVPRATQVEIPVRNLTAGTVAVRIRPDGTEEVIRKSSLTETGVTLQLEEDASIKLLDRGRAFQDVPEDAWCRDAVDFLSARELMRGTTETAFSPNVPLSRAMLATILYNLEGNPAPEQIHGFQDVTADSWCAASISWAVESGVLMGYENGTAAPDRHITREQLAVMLYRYAGQPGAHGSVSGYTDGSAVSDFAASAMSWAVENGILQGKQGNRLDPQGQATRAQAAQMLMRFMT